MDCKTADFYYVQERQWNDDYLPTRGLYAQVLLHYFNTGKIGKSKIHSCGSLAQYIQIARERTASLVVLPPLVLGYDELYSDSSHNSTENGDPSHTENEHERNEIKKLNGEELYADSDFLNADTEANGDLNNHKADGHRKLAQNLKEIEIAGKLVLPQKLFGCNCPSGMHNPNTEH